MEIKFLELENLVLPKEWKGTLSEIQELSADFDFDMMPPININQDNVILDGVKRYMVCIRLDYESVPVVYQKKTGKVILLNNYDLKSPNVA
jgi:hypothetical protein